MRRLTSAVVLAAGLTCWTSDDSWAQQREDHRIGVIGGVGWGQIWGDESNLGSGPTVSAGIEIPLSRGWAVEVEVSRFSHERSFSASSVSGDGFLVSGSAVYRFGVDRVQPFVLFGVGLMHRDGERRFAVFEEFVDPDGIIAPVPAGEDVVEFTESLWSPNLGAGLEIRLIPSLSLRPQVRYFGMLPRQISVSIAAVLRF